MKTNLQQSKDYRRIEQAIAFLVEHFQEQPNLEDVAGAVGMNAFHLQRLFTRWAGVSPKRFLQFLTKEYAKVLLVGSNVLDTSFDVGLSSPSRLHDLMITTEAMSPGEIKSRGTGLVIEYGFHPTPFGECFLAATSRGICHLSFNDQTDRVDVIKNLRRQWTKATIKANLNKTKTYIEAIFGGPRKGKITLVYGGTNFQMKVWEALLRIPKGKLVSYQKVAQAIGNAKAVRAVGTAVGSNPIAYLIPCHRVIRQGGGIGGYRWGLNRKRAMLALESMQS